MNRTYERKRALSSIVWRCVSRQVCVYVLGIYCDMRFVKDFRIVDLDLGIDLAKHSLYLKEHTEK